MSNEEAIERLIELISEQQTEYNLPDECEELEPLYMSISALKQITEIKKIIKAYMDGEDKTTNCENCTHYGEDLHEANCRFCHEYSRYERRCNDASGN